MAYEEGHWVDATDDIAVWVDQSLLEKAKEHLDELPDYDELVGWDVHLTSQDILSRFADHGTWWAVEFEDYPFADIDEAFVCEVGVYVAWFSESLAPGLDGPGYAAGVSLGYPPRPDCHWQVDEIEDAVCVYAPEEDGADGDEAMRALFEALRGIWGQMS